MRKKPLVLALLFAPAVAFAQGAPQASRDRLAQTAETYAAHAWRQSAPRAGLHPLAVAPAGFARLDVAVDPARAEARVRFAAIDAQQAVQQPEAASVVLVLRLHGEASGARKALLGLLTATQRTLEPLPEVGDAAFAARDARGLVYAAGVFGDVSFTVRALGAERLEPVVAALASALRATSAREGAVDAPRLLSLEAGARREDGALPLRLDLDPAGPAAAHVAFDCGPEAAVVETDGGYLLYATRPGAVRVEVSAATKDLRAARAVFEVVVPEGR